MPPRRMFNINIEMPAIIKSIVANMLFRSLLFLSVCFGAGAISLNITVGELPEEISQELLSVPEVWFPEFRILCQPRLKSSVLFYLYNREHRTTPVLADPVKTNFKGKKLIVLIHGWLTSYVTPQMQALKDAYLEKYDANVLMVNWSKGAMNTYQDSYCYIGVTSQLLSKFLCHLYKKTSLPLSDVHVIGHSTGSHIAGLTGNIVNQKCRTKIGRVTALDPTAQVGSVKLSKTSADYVDVIHTDTFRFGENKNFGHADYYPNCGSTQPGCKSVSKISYQDSLDDVLCSHLRSIDLMTESIGSANAVSVSCAMCPRFCRPDAITETYSLMGEQSVLPSKNKNMAYLLVTRDSPPYFTAWNAYHV